MEGNVWGSINARWGKKMLLDKCRLPRDLGFPANSGQELTVICLQDWNKYAQEATAAGKGTLNSLSSGGIRSPGSPTKPKPGAQRTKGQELSEGTDLLATADFSQPHLLSHLTKQSLHIQGCRNRDREASWLRPNATPYQAVGPSAQKKAT